MVKTKPLRIKKRIRKTLKTFKTSETFVPTAITVTNANITNITSVYSECHMKTTLPGLLMAACQCSLPVSRWLWAPRLSPPSRESTQGSQ